jgi:hypothetical protein
VTLKRSVDRVKDQTYFLSRLNQVVARDFVFPLPPPPHTHTYLPFDFILYLVFITHNVCGKREKIDIWNFETIF